MTPGRSAVVTEPSRRARRRMLQTFAGPAFVTLVLLAALVGLGVWQVERLGWKSRLLAQIDQSEATAPAPLRGVPHPFEKVVVGGHWLGPVARYGADVRDTPAGPRMGSQLIGALGRPGLPAVLVALGWVEDGAAVRLVGDARVTGFVRPAEHPGWLSARDNARTARFFTLDPLAIGKALSVDVEPFTVVALRGNETAKVEFGPQPIPAEGLPRPLNNHLSYAVTWFGLAATLLVVFGVWARRPVRR